MKIFITSLSMFIGLNKPAEVITSAKIGNWEEASTWDLNRVPTGQDIVVIAHDSISITGDAYVHELCSVTGGKIYFAPTAHLIFQ